MTNPMNTLSRRHALAMLASLPLGMAATSALAQAANFRIASVNAPTALSNTLAEETGKRIQERTEGRVTFQMFPSAQLGTTTDTIEQASQGQPTIAYASASFLSQFGVPDLAAVEGPFIVSNAEEAQRLASSDLMQGYYDQLAQTAGLRVLALNWFDGARHMIGTKPYVSPSDLDGVKMRVPPLETWLNTFEPMGVVATTVEAAEAYSALSQGVVTAGESPLTGLRANRWYEVVKEITLTGHFNLFLGWITSEKAFQALSEDDRAIMIEEFRRGGQQLTEQSIAQENEIRKEFEAAGVTFHDPDLDAYRAATASFFEDLPEGLFDRIRTAATS
ncbi:TRAP transporter substrate-binding protein DctP [Sulfitobacter indolifex]|uniref:TRAP transporter substrate-binding protein DctP n=1 Tax=Sulfitobacter indolifex TaxID=225422 RepID=UPI001F0E31C8|nr:TRAP transporter substrate-binding protein DctP [Sulfitobacter indolifex]